MIWVKKWEVKGSDGKTYVVSVDKNGEFGCSCPVWRFKRRECKHIQSIKKRLNEKELWDIIEEARGILPEGPSECPAPKASRQGRKADTPKRNPLEIIEEAAPWK